MSITEHIEGDECKFAAWAGRAPVGDNKWVMKVSDCNPQLFYDNGIDKPNYLLDNIILYCIAGHVNRSETVVGEKAAGADPRNLLQLRPATDEHVGEEQDQNQQVLHKHILAIFGIYSPKHRQNICPRHYTPLVPYNLINYPSRREFEDGASLDGSLENMEQESLASFGSGNTTDSDPHHHRFEKVGMLLFYH